MVVMKILSMLSWNVRCTCSARSRRMIKGVVLEHKINLFCLQETKCINWNSSLVSAVWKNANCGWLESPAAGLSGGLITVWDKSLYNLVNFSTGANWIKCTLLDLAEDITFHVVNVYSPQELSAKKSLWSELATLVCNSASKNCVLLGNLTA